MAKINGTEVPTVNIRGKEYPTVSTRIQVAHQGALGSGFSMVGNELVNVKDRDFIRITIRIGENQFSGTAEIHWNAAAGSADATAPYETAETSALGRALAMAGFVVETVASADEMERAGHAFVDSEPPRQIQNGAKALPEPKKILALECKNLADALGYSDEQRADLKQQYTSQKGLVSYDAIYAHLQREAKDREMEHLHAALAANPAD